MSVRDEFDFIKKVQPATLHHSGLIGIGDDAAIFSVDARFEQIVCVDTMVEDKHFLPTTMSPFHIGYKSLVANISDIAAMGGIPQYYLVSISIPSNWKESELLEIYDGLKKAGGVHASPAFCAPPGEVVGLRPTPPEKCRGIFRQI